MKHTNHKEKVLALSLTSLYLELGNFKSSLVFECFKGFNLGLARGLKGLCLDKAFLLLYQSLKLCLKRNYVISKNNIKLLDDIVAELG